jgi:hypothetical protein
MEPAYKFIDQSLSKEFANALKAMGFNLSDISPDRHLTPDAHDYLAEMWEAGVDIDDMPHEMRLSPARCYAELLFLLMKGRIKIRKGLKWPFVEVEE